MDYTMCTSSAKGKEEVKLIITPTNGLESAFFNNIFTGDTTCLVIEKLTPQGEDVVIVRRDKS